MGSPKEKDGNERSARNVSKRKLLLKYMQNDREFDWSVKPETQLN